MGAGRYIKRPAFGAHFQAATLRLKDTAPSAVARIGADTKSAAVAD
jgi:hypothetical protein